MIPMTSDDILELLAVMDSTDEDLTSFIVQAVNSHNVLLHMLVHAERICHEHKKTLADIRSEHRNKPPQERESCLGCSLPRENTELETDYRRWQDAIRDAVIKHSGAFEGKIDGGGCESGDPLDFTLAEIELGFAHLDDTLRERAERAEKKLADASDCLNKIDIMISARIANTNMTEEIRQEWSLRARRRIAALGFGLMPTPTAIDLDETVRNQNVYEHQIGELEKERAKLLGRISPLERDNANLERQIKAQKDHIADLEERLKCAEEGATHNAKEAGQQRARACEAEAKLKDIDDAYQIVIKGKCAPDEVHCTCVPHLRRHIADLILESERRRIAIVRHGVSFRRIAEAVLGDIHEGEATVDDVINYLKEREELHNHDCDRVVSLETKVKEMEEDLTPGAKSWLRDLHALTPESRAELRQELYRKVADDRLKKGN